MKIISLILFFIISCTSDSNSSYKYDITGCWKIVDSTQNKVCFIDSKFITILDTNFIGGCLKYKLMDTVLHVYLPTGKDTFIFKIAKLKNDSAIVFNTELPIKLHRVRVKNSYCKVNHNSVNDAHPTSW